jgi:hypothetical protein
LLTTSSSPVELPISEAWKMSRREPQEAVPDGTVAADCLAVDALARMRAQEITCLMILEKDGSPRGVVRLADLVREGIVEAAGSS